jgi:hypothetical protein
MSGAAQHDNRVLGGFKATLSNPNTSVEAKEHARDVLDKAGVDPAPLRDQATVSDDPHENRVLGGYKATLSSKCSLVCCLL